MRWALLIAGCVALAGCSHCDPGNCNGCCDAATDSCNLGTMLASCGTHGGACLSCPAADQCITGRCFAPPRVNGPNVLDFGVVALGTQASQSITLTNAGDLSLQITQVDVDDANRVFSVEPVPDAPVDPSMMLIVTFDFAPNGPGYFNTLVEVNSNADPPYWLTLEGRGN